MHCTRSKKDEVWNHFVARAYEYGRFPYRVTGRRIRNIKQEIMECDDFWFDIVVRYGLSAMSPEELIIADIDMYLHCSGNFWGVVAPSAIKGYLIL